MVQTRRTRRSPRSRRPPKGVGQSARAATRRPVAHKQGQNIASPGPGRSYPRGSHGARRHLTGLRTTREPPAEPIDARDPSGVLRTIAIDGSPLDLSHSNPFFQSLGTNGRSCSSCHVASSAWTITPVEVQQRFAATNGLDPIFRTVDGSNSPDAKVSTVQDRRTAFSMLLTKGRDPHRLGHPGRRGIRAGARRRPLQFRDCLRALALPASSSRDKPPVPHRRHVGRTRVVYSHGHDPNRVGCDARSGRRGPVERPEAPGQRRDPDARAGGRPADRRAGASDR